MPGRQGSQAPDGAELIARVGDQDITYRQLSTMLNSSAVVGVSIPAVGSPQRDGVMVVLLDKIISANLLYLDALKRGEDDDPNYQLDLEEFSDDLLALLYRERHVVDTLDVSEDDIQAALDQRGASDRALPDEARPAMIALLRKKKYDQRLSDVRDELRAGVEIVIDEEQLNPEDDDVRSDSDIVATFGTESLTWGAIRAAALAAENRVEAAGGRIDEITERVRIVNDIIDKRLMARKARIEGFDEDPGYKARYDEYSKTRLINIHRQRLLEGMVPTEAEIDV
ncbi:MAG: hypothetical protein JJ992_17035, partial [Planctomycetes bacterium]|nr:hypothetical protein [Planctomycetota bacterium]